MLAMVRYPSQTLRQGGQSPIGKVGQERKLGAASFLKLMPSCSKKRHNRIVADLDPALCQRAAKPACFVIQFTSGARQSVVVLRSNRRLFAEGAILPAIFDFLYREYCRSRLVEMRKQLLLVHPKNAEVSASDSNVRSSNADDGGCGLGDSQHKDGQSKPS